jgi:uracil-DNA glycosylase family 4
MKNRRDEMLYEMGITTVWHLREAAGQPADTFSTAVAEALSPDVSLVESSTTPGANAPDRSVVASGMDWTALKAAVAGCRACALHQRRNNTVFGVGDEQADWLFVGEGPGAEEDEQGEPFVGQAGKLLDNMLASIGLLRGENVYIANVVKCRPPGNRNPMSEEAAACDGYLQRQIKLIQPRLIVALGKISANHLLGREASIASLRGRLHETHGIPLIVTYHPAYLLRNLPDKAKAWIDLCFAVETLERLKTQEAAPS